MNKKIFFINFAYFALTVFFILGPFGVSAQSNGYVPLAPLPGTVNNYSGCDTSNPSGSACSTDITTYVIGMFRLLIGVTAVLSVITIVLGGIQYMSTDAISDKKDGKQKIERALYGLFLAAAAWLILYTINPDLLNTGLIIPPAGSATP